MLRLPVVLVTFLAGAAAFGQTPENTKQAKIIEIFRATRVDQMQKQAFNQVQAMLEAQFNQTGISGAERAKARESSRKAIAMVSENMSWEKLKPAFIQMYDETFTEDEISGLLLFYQSDAGKAMLEKMPVLQTKMFALIQDQMKMLMPQIKKMSEDAAAAPK